MSEKQRRGFRGPTKRIVAKRKRLVSDVAVHRRQKERVEIQKIKNSHSACIPRLRFAAIVKELTRNYGAQYRFQALALDILQNAAEALLTQLFADANLLAEHARRVTIMDRDVVLLLKI